MHASIGPRSSGRQFVAMVCIGPSVACIVVQENMSEVCLIGAHTCTRSETHAYFPPPGFLGPVNFAIQSRYNKDQEATPSSLCPIHPFTVCHCAL